ncbi:MAG TPA: ABC transporter substrate-binding protein, partial [Paenibacillus sp.]|nr:ABC transporter substrate-binding protein [Paenibacillus sp.]
MRDARHSLAFAVGAAIALSTLAGCGTFAVGGAGAEQAEVRVDEAAAISIMANLHTPEVPSALVETMLEEATGTAL